jgi:hypothetical protein
MTELLDGLRTKDPHFEHALLNPRLGYLIAARAAAGGDLDQNIILLVIAVRAVEHPEFRSLSDKPEDIAMFPSLGVNTRSIAESSGIPREMVRRKAVGLVRKGWIVRDGANLHFTGKAWEELATIRGARERLAIKYYELVRDAARNLPSDRDTR